MAKGELRVISTPNDLITQTNAERSEDAFIALAGERKIQT